MAKKRWMLTDNQWGKIEPLLPKRKRTAKYTDGGAGRT